MSNTPDQIDMAITEILNTHRSETWATGWNNEATEEAHAAIKLLVLKARKDEIGNLGYDKRLDDPILYLEGDKVISRADRIKSLEDEMKGLER